MMEVFEPRAFPTIIGWGCGRNWVTIGKGPLKPNCWMMVYLQKDDGGIPALEKREIFLTQGGTFPSCEGRLARKPNHFFGSEGNDSVVLDRH